MFPTVILAFLVLPASRFVDTFRMFKYARSVNFAQTGLQSPCPSTFQYQTEPNGNIYGLVGVNRVGNVNKIQLDVELSLGNAVQGYNGKITLAEDKSKVVTDILNGKSIYYRVHFPAWRNFVPRVTKIEVNGILICSGPTIPVHLVPILTTINLQHKLSLAVTSLISSPVPSQESSTFNNLSPAFGIQGDSNQPTIIEFDVRDDNLPAQNNLHTDNFNGASNKKNVSNPFLNVNNPYNFNPPPRKPSSTDKISFAQNPFLVGLSTAQPPGDDKDDDNNDFFDTRTSESPPVIVPQGTNTPSKLGSESDNMNVNEICGRPIVSNSLVFNGQNVLRGAYPWLVAIFRQMEDVSLNYICSGSLISERHVVTAAHCVKLEYRRVKPSEIVCVFGKLNIRKWISVPGERMLEPESIIIHPDYETGKANADIAVMTFADPIPFSKLIRPVCLWQGSNDLNQVVGSIGTVVGWGRDENGDISTAEPRKVNMPIVDQLECLKGSSSTVGQALVEIVSKNTFCAGFRNGSGPCNGDSGSAFLLRRDGIFYLRGIVSTALSEVTHRTCNLQEYVVFTDASKYLNWLLNIMRQRS